MDKVEACLSALLPRLTDEERGAFGCMLAGCACNTREALDAASRLLAEAKRLCKPNPHRTPILGVPKAGMEV